MLQWKHSRYSYTYSLSLKVQNSLLCPKQNAMQLNDGAATREYFMWWRSQISLWKHMPAYLSRTGYGALYLQYISNISALSLPEIFKSPSLSLSQPFFTASFLLPPNATSPPFAKYCSSAPRETETFYSLQTHPLSPCCFPFLPSYWHLWRGKKTKVVILKHVDLGTWFLTSLICPKLRS